MHWKAKNLCDLIYYAIRFLAVVWTCIPRVSIYWTLCARPDVVSVYSWLTHLVGENSDQLMNVWLWAEVLWKERICF